ncbi:hypothetical protein JD844_025433 [Phrynosoma platyrhinos]|uniref:Uncharacterized protein n=1 Tax=Phrynosoma platyrhinos TaxID=52577 RepID=A0ABQ7SZM3_PHRPL|nr:hypothetical protein JD844_025433 [Phrynosoma platyrhinos]
MNFEDLLQEAGGFGKFQLLTLLLLCLPRLFLPLHFLLHNFLAAIPPHHCAIPHQNWLANNLTKEEVWLISIPRDSEGVFSSCKMFSEPQFHLLVNSTQETTDTTANFTTVQSCQHGWIYDQSQFTSTIATQVNVPSSLSFGENEAVTFKMLAEIWVANTKLMQKVLRGSMSTDRDSCIAMATAYVN